MSKNKSDYHKGNYTIDQVFEWLKLPGDFTTIDFEGTPLKVKISSIWLKTFLNKGIKCANCDKIGDHFKITFSYDGRNQHLNLFTADNQLMTCDHIIPRSKGGKDSLTNTQTMCDKCNFKKGATLPGDLPAQQLIDNTEYADLFLNKKARRRLEKHPELGILSASQFKPLHILKRLYGIVGDPALLETIHHTILDDKNGEFLWRTKSNTGIRECWQIDINDIKVNCIVKPNSRNFPSVVGFAVRS